MKQDTSQCDTADTPLDGDSDTDFVCLRPGRRVGRMICNDEDSGKSNSSCSSYASSSGTSAKNVVIIDGEREVQVPELHKELEETMLGLAPGCKVSIHSVIKHLKVGFNIFIFFSTCRSFSFVILHPKNCLPICSFPYLYLFFTPSNFVS